MRLSFLQSSLLCALGTASAYVVNPPTTALPDTNPYCNAWQVAEPWMTNCNNIANAHSLPIYSVGGWNPSCKSTAAFVVGNSYCIGVDEPKPTPTAPPASCATPQPNPTAPANGVTTPSPVQDCMTTSCNKFYLVEGWEDCYDVVYFGAFDVSMADFYSWNPSLGGYQCPGIQAGSYVCVGVLDGSS